MSYLVFARKYRPRTFDELIGQEHITEILKNAVRTDRVAHAYLFCGPRGIGKTSCARILAKCLNNPDGPTIQPDDSSAICQEIARGTSFDVLEIDGASNRGIDEVRTLRENVKFAPTSGRYKIYIIDEVHMLTTEAFNALLKTLEEPPEHVKFIFATTDPNKVPATIISRCQRFDFKRVPLNTLVQALGAICQKEGLQVNQEALFAIAKAAQGGVRDALSILDQVSAINERQIACEDVYQMLGLVETDWLFDLSAAVAADDCPRILTTFDQIIAKGKDIKQLSRDLVEHYRNLMVIKIGGKSLGRLVDYPVAIKETYLSQSEVYTVSRILCCIDYLIEAQDVSRITESLRTPLEIAFAKMTLDGLRPAVGTTQSPPASAPSVPSSAPKTQSSEVEVTDSATPRDTPPAASASASSGKHTPETSSATATAEPVMQDASARPPKMTNAPVAGEWTLARVQQSWSALTHSVSREKMSLATYLQEGYPVSLEEQHLTVAFPPEWSFHKESLDTSEARQTVERIFEGKLGFPVVVRYVLVDQHAPPPKHQEAEDPLIKKTLETFSGKIVSRWHNE